MIRFVNISGNGTGNRFSWWDTANNKYLEFDGEQAWETWDDFMLVCTDGLESRLTELCPAWAREKPIVCDIDEFYDTNKDQDKGNAFDSLKSLVDGYYNSTFNPKDYRWFNCKYELFINDDNGQTLFNRYYGGSIDKVCAIFGVIPEGVQL